MRQRFHIGTCHTAWREEIGGAQPQPSQHWSEGIATGLRLLLHKATGLKRHQQAVHRTFGQTKSAGNVVTHCPSGLCSKASRTSRALTNEVAGAASFSGIFCSK